MSFVRKIWRDIKRGIIILLVIAIAGSVYYTIKKYGGRSKKSKYVAVVDCDPGNGIDDLFALSRILAEPEFKLIGITSSQWDYSSDSLKNTAKISCELIDTLLKLFKNENIPFFCGGDPVKVNDGKHIYDISEASKFIIRKAHEMPKNKKLNIITSGSLTNLATAVLIDSSIAPKIRIYALAMKYSPSAKVWNKNEMNVRNDLDALDFLLDRSELEIYLMPLTTAMSAVMDSGRVSSIMRRKGPQWDFLMDQWARVHPGEKYLSLPGLSLIESYMNTDFVRVEQVNTPQENRRRMVHAYTYINREYLVSDYINSIRKYITNN